MLALRNYQRAIAAALLSSETGRAAILIDRDNPPADRLGIHRNTMLTVLAKALTLTFPAVAALLGAAFFAQAARAFIGAAPPRAPLLSLYGEDFASFLADYEPVRSLAYLPDVARLEWAVECATRGPMDGEAPPRANIDLGRIWLTLVPSLALMQTGYPAEPIWRAALEQDGDALSRIDVGGASTSGTIAVWRGTDGAAVMPLGPSAAAFLQELLAGGNAESAINAAAAVSPESDAVAAITMEILPATFTCLTPK